MMVLLSGTKRNFSDELRNWFAEQGMAAEVTVTEGQASTWVICSMPHHVAAKLHGKLSEEGVKPFFVDAVFPASVAPTPQATVIRGPARQEQEKLIAELAPMTATPDARHHGATNTARKKAPRSSRAKI